MPPKTDIRDNIDRIRDRVWSNPLKVCVLQHYYQGKFCFPLGPEFGCGSTINITEGKSFSLSAKFGAKGAEVGASATFTVSVSWSHKAEKCQWCAPIVCYPNSTLEVWECEHFLDWFSWTSDFVRFTPGRGQIFPNCKEDKEKCSCNEVSAQLDTSENQGFLAADKASADTVVIRTSGFRKKYGARNTDPIEDAENASQFIESFLEGGPGEHDCEPPESLIIVLPDGRDISVWGPNAEDKFALLSLENGGFNPKALKVQKDNLLPVFAVGPAIKGAQASIKLLRRTPDEEVILDEEKGLVNVGQLTTVWKELQIDESTLKPGEQLDLVVDIYNEERKLVSKMCEKVQVPYFPQFESEISTRGNKKGK